LSTSDLNDQPRQVAVRPRNRDDELFHPNVHLPQMTVEQIYLNVPLLQRIDEQISGNVLIE
jgi:hypothetical protein